MKPFLARHRYYLREALVNMVRARTVNTLTIGIIAASLFILGGFFLLVSNLRSAVSDWNRISVNVYLKDDAPPESVESLRAAIAARPGIREVRYVSREEAAAIFRERFAHLASAADAVGGNPFPASLEILSVGGEKGWESTGSLAESLRKEPVVEEVRDNEGDARKMLALIRLLSAGGWVIGGILSVASFFTIFNVIRLTVYQRRDEIGIMRLVGATGGFIRAPFLLEGTLQGVIGALAAEGLLFFAYSRLAASAAMTDNPFLKLLAGGFLSAGQAGALLFAGTMLGAAGSLLSLRRFLAD